MCLVQRLLVHICVPCKAPTSTYMRALYSASLIEKRSVSSRARLIDAPRKCRGSVDEESRKCLAASSTRDPSKRRGCRAPAASEGVKVMYHVRICTSAEAAERLPPPSRFSNLLKPSHAFCALRLRKRASASAALRMRGAMLRDA